MKSATNLAIEHAVDAQTVVQTIERVSQSAELPFLRVEWRRMLGSAPPWLPARRRFIALEYKQLFPLAPWARARKLKLPVVAVELPRIAIGRRKTVRPKWWTIRWKRNLILAELRVQSRPVFPNAPKWNPAHRLAPSALRITAKKSEWKPLKAEQTHTQSYSH